jgi:glyceraldehyde 3-phosphate dehydrogenase
VACPVKDKNALNIVMGVNDHLYNPKKHHLVTAASCTTNCLAPIIKVIQSEIGIEHGLITTIHDVTNTQTVVDKPHKDLRRARSSLVNLIPTSTGSATAIGLIFPELNGKLNGLAVRVPLLNASLTDCVFEMSRSTTVDEVNNLFKNASQGDLASILGYEERPLVSSDYSGDTRSCIIDGLSTMLVDNRQLKILAWYDNEVGYANRLMELVYKVASSIRS